MEQALAARSEAAFDAAEAPASGGIPLRMKLRRQFAVFLMALGMLFGISCQKKKAQLPPKGQGQAPTLAMEVPPEIPEKPVPEPETPPQPATTEEPVPKKPAPKHRPKKPPQPPPAAPASPAGSTVAVNRPPASPAGEAPAAPVPDIALGANVSSQQLTQQKQTTSELLESTEKDLKGLNRGLSHDEEAMLAQIKSYVAQSRKATGDGDFERAYNLAMKAHLLADALIKK